VSKQLAQGRLLPSRVVARPGRKTKTSVPESPHVNHYATESHGKYPLCQVSWTEIRENQMFTLPIVREDSFDRYVGMNYVGCWESVYFVTLF